jgi:hypothetical protein
MARVQSLKERLFEEIGSIGMAALGNEGIFSL